jgi:hypothetical protein
MQEDHASTILEGTLDIEYVYLKDLVDRIGSMHLTVVKRTTPVTMTKLSLRPQRDIAGSSPKEEDGTTTLRRKT